MAKKTKEQRIKAEMKRLAALYKDLPPAQQALAAGPIARAAFIRVEMEDLEAGFLVNGWTELFSQGKQEPYDRSRPQGQNYHSLCTNYLKYYKELNSMLPKDEPPAGDPDDGFDDFVTGRDDR